jgi:polar amino acid transport system substrate-binding protein
MRRLASFAVAWVTVVGFAPALPASAATLDRVAESGSFKIGYRVDAPPFSFKDDAGAAAGYSVDLCNRIALDVALAAGVAEVAIEYVPVGTDERFQAVVDGTIDILCGASTATLSRREQVSFSVPMFITGISAVMRSDAPTFLREVLAGQRPSLPPRSMVVQAITGRSFGARAGTTAETWLAGRLGRLATDAEMITVENHEDGIKSVQDGELDAYFGDRAILFGVVGQSAAPDDFLIADHFFTYEPYALAFERGDEDFRWLVDRTLSRIFRSAEFDSLFGAYFGTPGPEVRALFLINSLPE